MHKIAEHISRVRFKHILSASIKALIFIILLFAFFSYERIHFAALGSSCFAAFSVPKQITGRSKNLFFSYLTAVIIGMIFSYISQVGFIQSIPYPIATLTAIAIGITFLIELWLDIEHPPSAGIVIGFLIAPWEWKTPLAILIAIVFLIVFRDFLDWALAKKSKRVK